MSIIVRYQTDPGHTFVNFEVMHFGTSTVRGRFDDVAGTIEIDEATGAGKAVIRISTGSVSTGLAAFDAHLKSDAFLDVARHPAAQFVGHDFRWQDDRLVEVGGDLELLGTRHPVTLACRNFNRYDSPILKAPVAGGDFEATIERSRWGMTWGIDLGVPDKVRLLVQIEAARTP